MRILKIGRKYLNLDCVVVFDEDQDADGNPTTERGISVRTASGDGFRFLGKDAELLRRFLDNLDIAGNLLAADDAEAGEVAIDHGGLNLAPQSREGGR